MNNAKVLIDVDLMVVDSNGNLREGAKETLAVLVEKGSHCFLWSTRGGDYCREMVARHQLEPFVEGYRDSPYTNH